MSNLGFIADSTFLVSVFAAVAAYIVYRRCSRPASPPPVPQKKREIPAPRDFTKAELAPFNGVDKEEIYVGVLGKVYDVTDAAMFYGPGSAYHVFAGGDATIALSEDSTEPKSVNHSGPIVSSLRSRVIEWDMHYARKYPCIGRLVDGVTLDTGKEPKPEASEVKETESKEKSS